MFANGVKGGNVGNTIIGGGGSIVAKFSNHSSGTLSQTPDHTLDHTQNLKKL